MIERSGFGGVKTISFAIVYGDPIGIQFCGRIGEYADRVCFHAEGLLNDADNSRGGSLIELYLFSHPKNTNSLEKSQGTKTISIRSVLRCLKRDMHMTLGCEVVNFLGLSVLDDADQSVASVMSR